MNKNVDIQEKRDRSGSNGIHIADRADKIAFMETIGSKNLIARKYVKMQINKD